MNKINIVSLVLLLLGINVSQAQYAEWRIHPSYDTMYIPNGTDLIVASNASDLKTTLLNDKCEPIGYFEGILQDFHDGVAVTINPKFRNIQGLVMKSGRYVSLSKGPFLMNKSFPYFSEEYLIVRELSEYYRFIDTMGNLSTYRFNKAYPFFNGYSSCEYCYNQASMKKPIRSLMDKRMKDVRFTIKGDLVDRFDVDFVSSVNDEQVAVVVVDRKVYLYVSGISELKPLCAKENDDNRKEQAKLTDKIDKSLIFFSSDSNKWRLTAKCGKQGMVIIHFDEYMRPVSIRYTDTEKVYKKKEERLFPIVSPLKKTNEKGVFGISWGKKEMLAPQFEDVHTCFGDKAIVRKKGKYGIVQLFNDSESQFEANIHQKGESIPFIHKNFKTTIQVDFPSSIMTDSVSIDINDIDTSLRLYIDKTSWRSKKTPYGNSIQYDCVLGIPNTLSAADSEVVVTYPIQIIYNGFISPKIKVKVKERFFNNLSVIVDNDSKTLNSDGSFSFDFSLNYAIPNEKDVIYPVDVKILPESRCNKENKSLTSYKVKVTSLIAGENQIDIQVKEVGCPSTTWPLIINYKPKVEPTKEEPKGAEAAVTIEFKPSKQVTSRVENPTPPKPRQPNLQM